MSSKKQSSLPSQQILSYPINDVVANCFARYARYIILERALPDVRDGLKPVQRRILYAMLELGLTFEKSYKKAARVVGEVIGKFHPHGDSAVYAALCRMAQEWKLNAPLIEMQGNKGSIDGDLPAAMRYTESRLSEIAAYLLNDLKKNTVTFISNFDDSETEPVVLPGYFPNLLVNGAAGIAVGLATNIPPHNVGEVIDALILRIKNPDCKLAEIMATTIKGPDFPTGGIIQGIKGIKEAYKTGKGRIAIRGKTTIIAHHKLPQIVIDEIPYEVVKQDLIKHISDLRSEQKIHGIKDIRDETDRAGLRIVIDLTTDVIPAEICNFLFKNTQLQVYYNFNLVAIANKKPVQMSLINMLDFYINHQIMIVEKRSTFDLAQLEKRLNIIDGLVIALGEIDKVIKIIRNANDRQEAKNKLIAAFNFNEEQVVAIVQLRLYRLTATDIKILLTEKATIEAEIKKLKAILASNKKVRQVIVEELLVIKNKFSLPRKSAIAGEIEEITINEKVTARQEQVFITISYDGWVKVMNPKILAQKPSYEEFGRKPNDVLIAASTINNYDNLLLFTNKGNYLLLPIFKFEEKKWKETGIHINTLCKLAGDEKIISVIQVDDFNCPNINLAIVTKNGLIKRTILSEFMISRTNKSVRYIKLKGNDSVVSVNITTGFDFLVLSTKQGFTLRYLETKIPLLSKNSFGVKALNLHSDNDEVVGMASGNSNAIYGVVTSAGTIKRLLFNTIDITGRTTKGNKIFNIAKNKNITMVTTFLCPDDVAINVLTSKEKWQVIKAKQIALTKVKEGMGKACAEDIVAAGTNIINKVTINGKIALLLAEEIHNQALT